MFCKSCVDCRPSFTVALLAEGVDRNLQRFEPPRPHPDVALLAEGVDRNKNR